MNHLSLAIAVTGLVILGPVAGATPLGPMADGPAAATFDEATLEAAHSNATATDASGANTSTAESPGETASTPALESSGNEPVAAEPGPPANLSPGSALAGAVSAQGVEVESAVDQRAFDRRLNASIHNGSKAAQIATRQAVLADRLRALRNRSRALQRAQENGSIGESRYRAAVTTVAAESTVLQRGANQTERAARGLPREALAGTGVNTTALGTLSRSASELTGRETRRIAQAIAGPMLGHSVGPDRRPSHAGPRETLGPDRDAGTSEGTRGTPDRDGDSGRNGPRGNASDRDTSPGSSQNESTDDADGGASRRADSSADDTDENADGDRHDGSPQERDGDRSP